MKQPRSRKLLDNPRLRQLCAAYKSFLHIAYGSDSPDPVDVVMCDWRAKENELRAVSKMACFDLVEMGQILDSTLGAPVKAFPKSGTLFIFDSVRNAADYLRGGADFAPNSLTLPVSGQPIEEALRKRDCNFFIALGKELTRELESQDLDPDKLKWFLAANWMPRIYGDSFWPGLAYMCNPARAQAYALVHRINKQDGPTLRGTWRRFGLIPAKSPFIRQVFLRSEARALTINFA